MDNRKWNEFLARNEKRKTINNIDIDRYLSDRDDYISKGGQENTAPYTKKPKRTRSKSAPPGFGGSMEEATDIEPSSFSVNRELQSDIWDDEETMNAEVSEKLLQIIDDFMEELPITAEVQDIKLTGSLANYNWSKYSDVDLHVVIDFSELDDNEELVKSYFDAIRMRWNDKHDIHIHGFEVEIYVENINEDHISSGVYSLTDEEWITKPSREEQQIDFNTADKKSEDIKKQISMIAALIENGKTAEGLRNIERVKLKIRNMRKAGLDSPEREFSPENIAFKILRREKALDKLTKMRYDAYDKMMSIDEVLDGI